MSFLEITVGHRWGTEPSALDAPLVDGPIVEPVLPTPGPTALPEVGERFATEDPFLIGSDARPSGLPVLAGTSLVVPPRLLYDCGSGLRTVVAYSGRSGPAFAEEIVAGWGDVSPEVKVADGDRTVTYIDTTSTDGAYFDIIDVPTGRDTGYLRIHECGD